jgi:hypothetical protein
VMIKWKPRNRMACTTVNQLINKMPRNGCMVGG